MGRSRRSRRSNDTGPGRGSIGAASFAVRPNLVRPRLTPRIVLQPIEDRRRHHPLGYVRPARQISGHPVRPLVIGGVPARRPAPGARRSEAAKVARAPSLSPTLRFDVPKRTIICVRRKRRREVIMATGKGGGRHRRPKRNYFTEVKCR